VKLTELAERLGCQLVGDGSVDVLRIASLEDAVPGEVSFLSNPKYTAKLPMTRASAVIVDLAVDTAPCALLRSANPYLAMADAVEILTPAPRPPAGVSPLAVVDPSATIGSAVSIGPFAVVGAGASVGARTVIEAHVVIGPEAVVGEDCHFHAHVSVRHGVEIGSRVVIQDAAVVGSDGFGFAHRPDGSHRKIPQVGRVVIEDDVEIGAQSAVDRPAIGETRIGRGTKIDNLVQVGHSVTIGEDSVLAGQVGIAGSTRLGKRVTLAGQVGVAGHLEIGDGVTVTAQTGIPGSVEAGALVSGSPAIENRAWLKSTAVFAKLPELQRRLRELERRVESLRGGR
jgi:UDP-3-O-[3-hydroxymyristoyl] glucosamine N-acyltransferase